MRRSLPQITQIYTDIGCREKDTNHTDVAQEKSVTIRGICGKTFSQAACGGVSHRLHRFTRILGTGKKDTNHTDVAQEKSVTIRGICGKTFSQEKSVRICEIRGTTSLKQRAEESPTDYADLHGYWVREKGHESHGRSIRKICDNPWNLWDNILSSKIRENL